MFAAYHSVSLCKIGLNSIVRLNVFREESNSLFFRAVSRRWYAQNTTSKKIEALCYLSGNGSFFSNHVDQEEEIFIPSRELILSKYGISCSAKPDNCIRVRMNGMENLNVQTPLVPIELSEDDLDEFKEICDEREKRASETIKLQENVHELKKKQLNLFTAFLAKLDKKDLSYDR